MSIFNDLRVYFSQAWQSCLTRIRQQPIIFIILILCFLGGSWLRLYNLSGTLMFQGDQGRDALVVARIFQDFDLAFIGPVTSIGNMYLGPFYYYFMLPFLWLSYPSPVGPAFGVALVNIVTISLMYFLGKKMVGTRAAIWATFFFAFSQLAIFYARFSWNPNLSATFTLLTLFFAFQACQKSSKFWLWTAIAAGLLLQLHYVNLIIVASVGLLWLWQLWQHRRQKQWFIQEKFWFYSFLALGIFLLTFTPLVLFDWKHGWRNVSAAFNIFGQEGFGSEVKQSFLISFLARIQEIPGRCAHLFATLLVPQLNYYWLRVGLGLAVFVGFLLFTFFRRRSKFALGFGLLACTAVISVLALAFYRHSVFDHYLLFALPIVFLIYGSLLASLTRWRPVFYLSLFFIPLFLWGNYQKNFFVDTHPNPQDFKLITQALLDQLAPAQSYNFVLLNDNRDLLGDNYRFYLQAQNPNLLSMEKTHDADVLFVIDETLTADLYDSSSYELVVFRNLPTATLSAIPFSGNPLLYKFEKLED